MRMTKLLIPTLKEDPSDAEVVSHKLMVRAGMIRKLTTGIYSYLPLGYRSLRKMEQIVREEMDAAGAQEVFLPMVQPAELWKESGRWDIYGTELLRFKDRHDRECCLGPTHEEVITDLVRRDVRSYRDLPLNLYQIQTKFRDEIRPRFGLMRGREFMMKDGYSFDTTEEGAEESYRLMWAAYQKIFERCGLRFRGRSGFRTYWRQFFSRVHCTGKHRGRPHCLMRFLRLRCKHGKSRDKAVRACRHRNRHNVKEGRDARLRVQSRKSPGS